MHILLIQPPIEDFYSTPIRFYPLGLLYTARVLQRLGHDVSLLDALTPPKKRQLAIPTEFEYLKEPFKNNPFLFKGYYRFGWSNEDILQRIADVSPDLIGISSAFTAYFESVAQLSKVIKSHYNIPIFIGGHHATVFAKEIRQRVPEIDDVLCGPAESALVHYPRVASGENNFIDWKYLQPAHELLETNAYNIGKRNYISLIASRGCPYTCEFCSVHVMFGRHIEYRTIDSILEEMRWNYEHHEVRIFNFEDDNLTFRRQWFQLLLQRIINDPLLKDIELTAMNGLCYPTLDEETLHLMHQAGFRQLNLSYVTHDQTLRRQWNRPEQRGALETLVKVAQNLGMFVTVYVIIGLPEQTFDEIKSTIDYLLNLGVLVGPSMFYIPPGSDLYGRLNLPNHVVQQWNLYRSSAFAVETPQLTRDQMIELFAYTREQNLLRK